jgi:M6 family metalloprotease-like protein
MNQKHAIAGLLFLAVGLGSLRAMEPLTREERDRFRADGSLARRIAAARLIGNNRLSPLLVERMQQKLAAALPASAASASRPIAQHPPAAWSFRTLPSTGTVRVLALLIAFSDKPPVTTADVIQAKLFGDGLASEAPYESLRNFYRRSSLGQLEIQGDTLGWYTTAYPRSSVPQTDAGRENLIKEALNYYEARGHDFRPYDNDGDGYIDYTIVIWSGKSDNWADFWWGYQTAFWATPETAYDGKKPYTYSWQWESDNPAAHLPYSANTVIHETGHAMGLPDYYDYDDTVGPNGGLGGFDMMDGSSHDHNCFSKFLLDWIQPTIIANDGKRLDLRPSGTSPDAALLMPDADGSAFGEFFMVQHRNRSGNDTTFPGVGLLVWHIDSRLNGEYWNNYLYDNSYTDHKLLRVMEADGSESIENGGVGDVTDLFRDGNVFNAVSKPNSDSYDFQPGTGSHATNVAVDGIAASGTDFVCQASAQTLASIALTGSRGVEKSWLTHKSYATLTVTVTAHNASFSPARAIFIVYRRQTGTTAMTEIGRETGSFLQNSSLTIYDRKLDSLKTYDYQVVILDGAGYAAGVSPQITL